MTKVTGTRKKKPANAVNNGHYIPSAMPKGTMLHALYSDQLFQMCQLMCCVIIFGKKLLTNISYSSVQKQLWDVSKGKKCSVLKPWIPSISNMLWWSFATSVGNLVNDLNYDCFVKLRNLHIILLIDNLIETAGLDIHPRAWISTPRDRHKKLRNVIQVPQP